VDSGGLLIRPKALGFSNPSDERRAASPAYEMPLARVRIPLSPPRLRFALARRRVRDSSGKCSPSRARLWRRIPTGVSSFSPSVCLAGPPRTGRDVDQALVKEHHHPGEAERSFGPDASARVVPLDLPCQIEDPLPGHGPHPCPFICHDAHPHRPPVHAHARLRGLVGSVAHAPTLRNAALSGRIRWYFNLCRTRPQGIQAGREGRDTPLKVASRSAAPSRHRARRLGGPIALARPSPVRRAPRASARRVAA
jgi:hypothetical protein